MPPDGVGGLIRIWVDLGFGFTVPFMDHVSVAFKTDDGPVNPKVVAASAVPAMLEKGFCVVEVDDTGKLAEVATPEGEAGAVEEVDADGARLGAALSVLGGPAEAGNDEDAAEAAKQAKRDARQAKRDAAAAESGGVA